LKDGSELAAVTTGGRLFHTRAAATQIPGRWRCVYSLVRGTMNLWRLRLQIIIMPTKLTTTKTKHNTNQIHQQT